MLIPDRDFHPLVEHSRANWFAGVSPAKFFLKEPRSRGANVQSFRAEADSVNDESEISWRVDDESAQTLRFGLVLVLHSKNFAFEDEDELRPRGHR